LRSHRVAASPKSLQNPKRSRPHRDC
jgi:hypothetical protein